MSFRRTPTQKPAPRARLASCRLQIAYVHSGKHAPPFAHVSDRVWCIRADPVLQVLEFASPEMSTWRAATASRSSEITDSYSPRRETCTLRVSARFEQVECSALSGISRADTDCTRARNACGGLASRFRGPKLCTNVLVDAYYGSLPCSQAFRQSLRRRRGKA